jgi:hypothetical protein
MNNVLDISMRRSTGRKGDLIYTQAYFDALRKIVDKRPHRCAGCGIADGSKEGSDGRLRKFPAVVRLCLTDPNDAPNDARNVDMYCTRCRKAPLAWRTPRRMKPAQLQQLFVSRQAAATEPPRSIAA